MPEIDLKREFRITTIEGGFSNVTLNLTAPFLVLFAIAIGANNFEIALLVAANSFFALLGGLPAAWLLERTGKRKKLTGITALVSRLSWIAVAALPFVFPNHSIWFYIAIVSISAFLMSVSALSWTSWMADLVSNADRGSFFGKRNYIIGIVSLLTLIAAQFILGYFGNAISSLGLMFVIAGLSGIACYLLVQKMSDVEFHAPERKQDLLHGIHLFRKEPNFLKYTIFFFVWNLGIAIPLPFWDVYSVKVLGFAPSWIALFAFALGFGTILATRLWGALTDKYGNRNALVICASGISLIPFFWLFVTVPEEVILINLLGGMFWAGLNLAAFNYQIDITPKQLRPRYIALFTLASGLPLVFGPFIGFAIIDFFSQNQLFSLGAFKWVFIISCAFRFLSVPIARELLEPKKTEARPRQVFLEFVLTGSENILNQLDNIFFVRAGKKIAKTILHTARQKLPKRGK